MYDAIIVGAGYAGAVAARSLAEKGRRVLVVEQRGHIGGNAYDVPDENGVLIHLYGPHIFHTDDRRAYEFLSRFTKWRDYHHEVMAKVGGRLLPIPFNLNTLEAVYGAEGAGRREEKLVSTFGAGAHVPILKLRAHPDPEIREIAEYVYENIFLRYTMKQWGQAPEEIDPSVTARVPVVLSRDNGYFSDTWQGMPEDGYTPMFEKMLAHECITLRLHTEARECLEFKDGQIFFEGGLFAGDVVYTGPIDELFGGCFGKLPYRSLEFVWERYQRDEYQPCAVVNYTVDEDFTRITEFKKLTGQELPGATTIVKEYPVQYGTGYGQIPYYAIINEGNLALYGRYRELSGQYPGLHLLGRLAEYKYYNMDAITKQALELCDGL